MWRCNENGKSVLETVRRYIKRNNLLNDKDLYLVALSGGADSVCLLLVLKELGYQVHAAHCNFRLRGEESNRDEAFCETLSQQMDVPFHRAHFDTTAYAEGHHVSIEMASRELRYRWFEQLRQDIGASGICVAHHRDDSVETVLLNMIRGTGLRGLTGIQPRNGFVLRPLLGVARQEIEGFLKKRGQAYVTDSTNLETDVMRNKIRLQLLPMLRELSPAIADNIQHMSEHLSEAQEVLDAVSDHFKDRKALDLEELKPYGSIEYLTFEWLKNYGFNGSQVRQALQAETGSVFTSAQGFDLLVNRGQLVVEPALLPFKPFKVPEEGTYILEDDKKFSVRRRQVQISKEPLRATIDAAKVTFPLKVRRAEEGDWLIPYGMTGRKLLSDLMTDRKMSVFEKRRQLVVVDGKGQLVWAVGLRTDARVAVSETTTEVFELSFS